MKQEYSVNLVSGVATKRYIPLFEGRPKRTEKIDKDDILNLRITLETAKTIEELEKLL